MRLVRNFMLLVCIGTLVLGASAIIGKIALERAGAEKARQVIKDLSADNRSLAATVVEVTRQVHGWYSENRAFENPPLLWRLRPYLTHGYLPEVFRLPAGLVDTLYVEGLCDSAAVTLGFILKELGIESSQLNIVNRFSGSHSVVLARFPDGREAMLDPFYGVVPKLNGELLSPTEALEAAKRGHSDGEIWHKLAPTSEDRFYETFEHAIFAVQNAGLEIEVPVTLSGKKAITLGQPDGDSKDVYDDGLSHELTSYWTYLGHKYDRGWTRILVFGQDTRVEMGLVEPVNPEFITTSVLPRIEGKTLIYEVAAGESLRFVDGLAKRDWIRLKSYQDIDYILFEPIL